MPAPERSHEALPDQGTSRHHTPFHSYGDAATLPPKAPKTVVALQRGFGDAPGWQGARSKPIGNMCATSNPARRDAAASASRPLIAVEPVEGLADDSVHVVGDVPASQDDVTFVLRRYAEPIEHRLLRPLHGDAVVAGAVDHQRGRRHPRGVVPRLDLGQLVEHVEIVVVRIPEQSCHPFDEDRHPFGLTGRTEVADLTGELVRGDALLKIAKQHYGNATRYPVIFEANKPMLKEPDKIYPGPVLRIPPLD